ncbi:hypothetical protein KMW28_09010 [Flammeovirga yaeyamensis]|uniref:Uncharacterized protein n=1 Tax=Flammeovirga yaeyamensis TaxID=367791 RepID=A0AAX1NCF5_9BACT|nr:hypothetical protein [Flammeovirga yaeyamensis]MBB3698896.1 hypothetical protein [Flammeovirga yaeyamensis]NMF36331.1 hypothetical protein [Flammeovirga yaeyamensis]QWG03708.1 hypothetical protein KMW28_09010 [Flammeovirga yaeyamensis]
MKKASIITLLALFFTTFSFAQSFVPTLSVNGMVQSKEAYVIKNDGSKITGKITAASLTNNVLKSVSIKTADGTKMKFKAADIKQLGVKPKEFFKFEQSMTAGSIKELAGRNFEDVVDQEYVYYEQALLPGKKNKFALMQLLNPGFDHVVKVYKDPNAKQTGGLGVAGVKVTGGIDKSYLVTDTGSNRAILIEKKKYKKEGQKVIFTKCPEVFGKYYAGDKFQWKDFAEHVYVYDQLCTDK